jgi:hypothetical protein
VLLWVVQVPQIWTTVQLMPEHTVACLATPNFWAYLEHLRIMFYVSQPLATEICEAPR